MLKTINKELEVIITVPELVVLLGLEKDIEYPKSCSLTATIDTQPTSLVLKFSNAITPEQA